MNQTDFQRFVSRALAELAEAILANEYGKNLHSIDIALLKALALGEPEEFQKAWWANFGDKHGSTQL